MAKQSVPNQDASNRKKKNKRSNNKKKHGENANHHNAASGSQVRAIKTQTNALLTLATFSNPNPKYLGPFSDRQRILVVGDGDFSFSLALAVFLGGRDITATCYDSKQELKEKYPNALLNVDSLETAGSEAHFNVDATALEKELWMQDAPPFHAIVFNFPHLGGATEEDVAKNQELLRNFFYSTRKFLHPTQGQVLVALRNTLFYNRWKIEEQAKLSGFQLKRKERFDSNIYSGYEPQRTHPASFRGEPPSTDGAHYFIFTIDKNASPPADPRSLSSRKSGGTVQHLNGSSTNGKQSMKKGKGDKTVEATSMKCTTCNLSFHDLKKYNGHMNSAKHARKVKAMKKR